MLMISKLEHHFFIFFVTNTNFQYKNYEQRTFIVMIKITVAIHNTDSNIFSQQQTQRKPA